MKLITLGGLALEPQGFSEAQPLLLLAFLGLQGPRLRGELKELFWPHQHDPTKRVKNLSEVLRRLRRLDPNLIEARGETLATHVSVDARALRQALARRTHDAALGLYAGPFLHGVERQARLRLGEELLEWIAEERHELQSRVLDALLALAEEQLLSGNAEGAGEYLRRALALPSDVALPEPQALERLHGLAAAAGLEREAERARQLAFGLQEGPAVLGGAAPEPVIGREAERAALRARFAERARLVTITGLGGSGKTALARAFVQSEARSFDLVAFVSLEALPESAEEIAVWQKVASAVGARTATPEAIREQLRGGRVLLVLDNVEHLARHAPAVIERLLRRLPQLQVLATSRSRLGLGLEHLLPLSGVAVPTGASDLQAVRRAAAGTLLLALSARHGVRFSDAEAEDLARLCQLVQGHPLALKLIAGWLPSLAPADAAARLAAGLELLTLGESDLPARHRSLAETFSLSLELLPREARQLLPRLSTFQGGFTLEAAERVADAAALPLRQLVDASLLEREGQRYALHPLVRQYASTLLGGEAAALGEAHAEHYLKRLSELTGGEQTRRDSAAERLRPEWDNVRAAWLHACAEGRQPRLAEATPALQRLCDLLSSPSGGLELVESALRTTSPQAGPVEGSLLAGKAWFLLRLGRYQDAIGCALRALEQLGDSGPPAARETSLNALGAAHDSLGAFEHAAAAFEQVLALAEPGSGEAATAHTNLAINALKRGDHQVAEGHLRLAEGLFLLQGKLAKTVWCACIYGRLHLAAGDLARARQRLTWALDQARRLSLTHWRLMIQLDLARLDSAEGQAERARLACQSVLREARGLKAPATEQRALILAGDLAHAVGDAATALAYYRSGLKRIEDPQSEPAYLHGLVRVARVWLRTEGREPMAVPLLAFCRCKAARMYAEDRRVLQGLGAGPCGPAPEEMTCSAFQVASQVLAALDDLERDGTMAELQPPPVS